MGKNEKTLKSYHYSIAGATSGTLARVIGQPLDVLKIRYQIQNKSNNGTLKYRSLFSSFKIIVKEEGISALWKGHVPAQMLSIIFGAVQFTSYEFIRNAFKTLIPDKQYSIKYDAFVEFTSGGIAGSISSFACQPLDVMRTRFVAQITRRSYNGVMDAFRKMYAEDHLRTFYKGLTPTLLVVFPNAGLSFAFYGVFKQTWETFHSEYQFENNEKMKKMFCGTLSGICSKAILLPLDLLKKRMQVHGFSGYYQNMRHHGLIQCAVTIFKNEGVRVFYRGVTPSILKAGLTTGVIFFTYESICDMLQNIENKVA